MHRLSTEKVKDDWIDKTEWIIRYMNEVAIEGIVHMNDEKFVRAYIEKFKPKWQETNYGAPRCYSLARLLGKMKKECILESQMFKTRSTRIDGFPLYQKIYSLYEPYKRKLKQA